MIRCPLCGSTVRKATIGMSFFNNKIKVNPVKANVCVGCGEQFLSKKEVKRLQNKVNTLKRTMQKEHIKTLVATI